MPTFSTRDPAHRSGSTFPAARLQRTRGLCAWTAALGLTASIAAACGESSPDKGERSGASGFPSSSGRDGGSGALQSAGAPGSDVSPGGSGGAGASGGSTGASGDGAGTSRGGASGETSNGGSSGAAGSPDDGGGARPAITCPVNAELCGDFENANQGQAEWPWITSAAHRQGSVSVDETGAYSGKGALHVRAEEPDIYVSAMATLSLPQTGSLGTHLFGRAMLKVDSLPSTSIRYTLIEGLGSSSPEQTSADVHYRLGGEVGGDELMTQYYVQQNAGETDCVIHSGAALPVNRWTCIEWEFDATTNTARYWMQGEPLESLTASGSAPGECRPNPVNTPWSAPLRFDFLRFGWEQWNDPDVPHELWIDDVAVGSERMGCPN